VVVLDGDGSILMNLGSLTTLVAKIEAKGPPVFLTDLPMLENRFQFQRYLRDKGA
jgi:hypothetical protein